MYSPNDFLVVTSDGIDEVRGWLRKKRKSPLTATIINAIKQYGFSGDQPMKMIADEIREEAKEIGDDAVMGIIGTRETMLSWEYVCINF